MWMGAAMAACSGGSSAVAERRRARSTSLIRRMCATFAAIVLALVGVLSAAPTASSQEGTVTFPSSPYEGLQLTFTVSGATLGVPEDLENIPDITYGAKRIYRDGTLASGPLTVTGYATGSAGAYGYLEISLTGSAQRVEFAAPESEWRQDFSLRVDNPEYYSDLTLNISIQRFSKFDSIGVSANFLNPNPLVQPPPTYPTPANLGKPPCPEAVEAYSLDPNTGIGIQYDYADIQQQFDQAITTYEQEASSTAYVQDNIGGTMPALAWLGNQGGATSVINRQFVFTSDADRQKWSTRVPTAAEVSPGTERALYEAIFAYHNQQQRKLTPGDVFYLALKQRNGNAKEAMLLAHNTLRSLARMEQSMGNTDFEWTMVEHSPGFITEYLAPVVDPAPLGEGQNTGSWYHMFGTAYFEMQARGTWGAYTLVQWTGDELNDRITELAQQIARTMKDDPNLQLRANQTLLSSAANEIEQLARRYIFHSEEDPPKYCYNATGAKIGAWLYQQRLRVEPAVTLPSGPPAGVTIPTIFGPLPMDNRPPGWKLSQPDPDTIIMSSPLSITWTDDQNTMVLDQSSASLYGYFPVHIFPQYEEADQTWGAIWTNTGTDAYQLTLQASQTGWAHLTRVHGNDVLTYPMEVTEGEIFTLQVDPDSPTAALQRQDGTLVEPLLLAGEELAEPDRDDGTMATLVIGALVLLGGGALLTLIVVLVARRGRQRQQPVAPAPARGPTRGQPSAAPGPGFCPSCGQPLRSGAAFCGRCGRPVR